MKHFFLSIFSKIYGTINEKVGVPEGVIRKHKPDYFLLLLMILLMLTGLIIMYSIGPQLAASKSSDSETYWFFKQLFSMGLSLIAFMAAAVFVPISFIQKNAARVLLVGFGACLLLVFLGNILHIRAIAPETGGAFRWFLVGPLGTFQPAEALKLGILVFCAGFLGMRYKQGYINNFDKTLLPLAIIGVISAVFVIFAQKDLGTGISLVSIVLSMLVIARLQKKLLLGAIGLCLIGGVIAIMAAPHRMARVVTYFSGGTDTQDAGDYQVAHAKIALGSGGLFGLGIGNSIQATGYLPEAQTDSVFAIMGEIFGFLGLMSVLAIFAALLYRILRIVDALADMRLKLLGAGVFGWLLAHIVLNIGSVTGVFPFTGITLPFLSFGGTSMIVITGVVGLIFQLSRYTVPENDIMKGDLNVKNSISRRGIRRPRHASDRRSSRA